MDERKIFSKKKSTCNLFLFGVRGERKRKGTYCYLVTVAHGDKIYIISRYFMRKVRGCLLQMIREIRGISVEENSISQRIRYLEKHLQIL